MNEDQIRDEARKAANRSRFKSNYIYEHKSYEDGFYEGMKQALRQPLVIGECEHPYHAVLGDGEMQPAKCLKCGKVL